MDKTQKEKIEEEIATDVYFIEAVAEELFQWELMPVTSYPESASDVMISIENKRREIVCLAKRKTFIKYAYYLIDIAIKETEERLVRDIEEYEKTADEHVEPNEVYICCQDILALIRNK